MKKRILFPFVLLLLLIGGIFSCNHQEAEEFQSQGLDKILAHPEYLEH
ncbi:MAG: hypothetical protein LUD68_04425 [Rikenellaceae bacterium]|nr:hypothetical protein [Rikenellaceae bacterium]